MNILLTGSGGYLGKYVKEKLEKNHNVFGYDIVDGNDILDFEKMDSFFQKHNIEYVVHLAAVANLNFYDDDIEGSDKINIKGSKNILELCNKYGAKLFFASTCCCYGSNMLQYSDETSVLSPTEPYSQSKKAIEDEIMKEGKTDHVIMRLATFYGGKNVRKEIVVPLFINKVNNGELIEIHGSGKQQRTYTHVEDVSDGIVSLVNNYQKLKYSVYNITGEEAYSIYDILSEIGKYFNKEIRVKYVSDRVSQFTQIKISNKRLRETGWECKYNLAKGIEESMKHVKC